MSRYFFDVHGVKATKDSIGEELHNDEAAWKEATLIAGELFKDIDGKFRPDQDWALEVTDADRKPLYIIRITAQKMK